MKIDVLDNGYVKKIEAWGFGETGEAEAAIIEAARQSTQGSFRGWEKYICALCRFESEVIVDHFQFANVNPCENTSALGSFHWIRQPIDEKLLSFLYENRHMTPFEFCGMTIEVQAPIFVFREWHRHRTQSYNEMSARYAPIPNENYHPTVERLFATSETNKQAQALNDRLTNSSANQWLSEVENLYSMAEAIYQRGLHIGVPKEVARIVMPVGRYSRMRASANLRNWLQFIELRSHPAAQWEIRQYSNAVADIIKSLFPRTHQLFQEGRNK